MSDIVEASVMTPFSEPKPTDKIAYGNRDAKTMVIPTANSVESGDSTPGHDSTDLTPVNSTAAAEHYETTYEEASTSKLQSITHPTGTTPKKRAAANKHESDQPSKKRSQPKGKNSLVAENAKEPKNSTTANDSTGKKGGLTKATTYNADEVEEVVPVGQKKRTTSGKKGQYFQAEVAGTEDENAAADTAAIATRKKNKPKPRVQARQRRAPENPVAPPRDIPASWDEADEADRMLVTRKENGDNWKTIYAAWEAMTGLTYSGSTLPNRYKRIKMQMMHLEEGDAERLLTARADVERKYKSEKFALIAAHVEQSSGNKYTALFLQKQLKELDKSKVTITRDDSMEMEIEDEAED